ncbi:MAG TPA: efflux RND transporter periplasmic adaptor subunit [Candidatus Paceibacterota bacterium]|nr:efflux RND transporter periplasmic adaptor subunit [Candidatus Paceibacterota bacterium]
MKDQLYYEGYTDPSNISATMSSISSFMSSLRRFVIAHKVWSLVVAIVVVFAGYWGYKKIFPTPIETRYTVGTVARGTIISTVSGSGQVSTTDSVDLKPKVSGEITAVLVEAGDTVRAGQAIAYIDSTDAQQSLADAKASYATALLQYQKDSAQAPIDYQNAQTNLSDAQTSLQDTYNDVFNHLTSTYLDLPALSTEAQSAIYGYDFDNLRSQWNINVLFDLFNNKDVSLTALQGFKDASTRDYTAAKAAYDASLPVYQRTSRTSSGADVESLLSQSITTMTAVAQALQSELNYYATVSDMAQTYEVRLPSSFSSVQSAVRSNLSTANSDLSTLLADKKAIASDKQSITNAQQQITLSQVGNQSGSNPISLQISKSNLDKQAQDIAQQESDLADYTVRAPFSGTVTTVNAKKGDTASSGSALATIITSQQIAQLSVNEIDAAKIKEGDKATLTFDAIDGLSITGTVAQLDSVGTVSQGVVSYTVKISFDTQDQRVKPGMTVNADIQSEVHQNVLTVPSSAIKTAAGSSYVQIFQPSIATTTVESGSTQGFLTDQTPVNVPVEIGISDDTSTEIISGLSEGEQIVTRTTTTAKTTTTTRTTTTRAGAGGIGGGAAIRAF